MSCKSSIQLAFYTHSSYQVWGPKGNSCRHGALGWQVSNMLKTWLILLILGISGTQVKRIVSWHLYASKHPMSKLNLAIIKMSAVSSCRLLLQPYWTIQSDYLACGSNSEWKGPSLTEGWHILQGSCVFCQRQHFFLKPSLILYTIYFSKAPFIHISTAHFTQKVNHPPVAKRKGRFFGGRFKEKIRFKAWGVVRTEERRSERWDSGWAWDIGRHRWQKGDDFVHGRRENRELGQTRPLPTVPCCSLLVFSF